MFFKVACDSGSAGTGGNKKGRGVAVESQLLDVLVILAAAISAAAVSRLLRTSVVLGYLVAGTVIGPHALGLLGHSEVIDLLAELGVVFLLFTVGLELPLQRLKTLRSQMAVSGLSQILVTAGLIAVLLWIWGIGGTQAVIVGAAISLSSTALVLRLLSESKEVSSRLGRTAVAVLLAQDLAVALILVLISLLQQTSGVDWLQLGLHTGTMLLAMAAFIIIGRYLLSRLFHYIAAIGSPEVFTAFTLLVVIGSALFSAFVELGMGLGAFVAGMLLADTKYRHQIAADILPFRMLLLGLFFLSVGMALDPGRVLADPLFTLATTFGILALKATVLVIIALGARLTLGETLRFSLLLSQAGEFSFVILAAGFAVGAVSAEIAQACGIAVAITMLLTPLLAAGGRRLQRWVEQRRFSGPAESAAGDDITGHIWAATWQRTCSPRERLSSPSMRAAAVSSTRRRRAFPSSSAMLPGRRCWTPCTSSRRAPSPFASTIPRRPSNWLPSFTISSLTCS